MKTSIPPSHEHPFAQFVRILGKGKRGTRPLTEDEAFQAMSMIMANEVEPVQLGAFLMLLRVKEESPEELLGFVKAVRQSIDMPPKSLNVDFDWSSYAGKRRHLPWYLLSTFLLAQKGQSIFMHGASGHTIDRLYTEDTLTALGIPSAHNWEETRNHLDQRGFAYMPLRCLSPTLHTIIELRNTLGLRSPVHTLSRLLNPLDAPAVMQGIFHPGYRPVHQEAAVQLGYPQVAVIKGEGGEIECNPDTKTVIQYVKQGKPYDEEWPALFSKRHTKPGTLSIDHLKAVWRGEADDEYGVGAIVSTTAIALTLKGNRREEALKTAQAWWDSRDRGFIA